jgi:hypothetical protein
VILDASEWIGGDAILRRVDAAVPPDVIVCPRHNPRGMADPDRWPGDGERLD